MSAKVNIVLAFAAAVISAQSFRGLKLLQTLPLQAETFHVQGIEVDDSRIWVTSVDKTKERGLLFLFDERDGHLQRSIEVRDGPRYHPGGLSADGDSLWIPVAEYRRDSTAVIQRRDKQTLALKSQFLVKDHIGAIAVTPQGIVGANWDARRFYLWDREGKELRTDVNPSSVAIQDMKFQQGNIVGGGTKSGNTGVLVWIAWPSLRLTQELAVGNTDRGAPYSREGFAIRGDSVWLLPEDDHSRAFRFDLIHAEP